jgi:hypothetical protein
MIKNLDFYIYLIETNTLIVAKDKELKTLLIVLYFIKNCIKIASKCININFLCCQGLKQSRTQ